MPADTISNRNKPDALNAVQVLQQLVDTDMAQVNDIILKRMQSPVQLIPQLAGHLINSGGKRLRPMLTLASAQVLGYTGDDAVKLAAVVEFIHTATLLHDDVVDESSMRRGKETANIIWGNQASVLVGDFLFSRSFELMVETDKIEVLGILSKASSTISEGEVLQLQAAGKIDTTRDTYMEVIRAKTAALFAAACEVSAVCASDSAERQAALRTYGDNLGIAFQIIDDVLDYAADAATMGKAVGDDFREGKVTLPVIYSYEAADEAEKAFWKRVIESSRQQDDDLAHAQALINKHNAITATRTDAETYGEKAKSALAIFDDSPAKQALLSLVDFCLARAY